MLHNSLGCVIQKDDSKVEKLAELSAIGAITQHGGPDTKARKSSWII